MKLTELRPAFDWYVEAQGVTLSHLTLQQALDLLLGFYRDQRFDGCELADGGDTVFFEWTTTHVYFVRQLIADDDIAQLPMSFTKPAYDVGQHWCESLEQIEAFSKAIRASAPFKDESGEPLVCRLSFDPE